MIQNISNLYYERIRKVKRGSDFWAADPMPDLENFLHSLYFGSDGFFQRIWPQLRGRDLPFRKYNENSGESSIEYIGSFFGHFVSSMRETGQIQREVNGYLSQFLQDHESLVRVSLETLRQNLMMKDLRYLYHQSANSHLVSHGVLSPYLAGLTLMDRITASMAESSRGVTDNEIGLSPEYLSEQGKIGLKLELTRLGAVRNSSQNEEQGGLHRIVVHLKPEALASHEGGPYSLSRHWSLEYDLENRDFNFEVVNLKTDVLETNPSFQEFAAIRLAGMDQERCMPYLPESPWLPGVTTETQMH